MTKFHVYGKEYETRLDTLRDGALLFTENTLVGRVTRVAPRELQLIGNRGFYRINAASFEALAKRHFEDTTGMNA